MRISRAILVVSVGKPAVEDGSVDRLLASLPHIADVRTHVILGHRTDRAPDLTEDSNAEQIHLVSLPASASLSASRNRLLAAANELALLDRSTVVNFPDDDSWFIDGIPALSEAIKIIEGGWDAVVGRYAPAPLAVDELRFPPTPGELTRRAATRYANSVSMVWSAESLKQIGAFDERLGAGTKAGSSEDLDLLLRGLKEGMKIRYEPKVLIGHGYHVAMSDRYYVGNVACLRKHSVRDLTILGLLCKRLTGGALRVVRGAMPVETYIKAWQGMSSR